LRDYVELGVEMRRMASAELWEEATVRNWEKRHGDANRKIAQLWEKGWGTMRIPRLAFGLLLATVVILGSSLVATRARAHGEGTVVLLSITPPGGTASLCPVSMLNKEENGCGLLGKVGSGELTYNMKFLSRDGDRIELGVQSKFKTTQRS
jgi:hypothetical protein